LFKIAQDATWRSDAVAVPEPATGTLFGLGLIAMLALRPRATRRPGADLITS
jgi:hypothetical protein